MAMSFTGVTTVAPSFVQLSSSPHEEALRKIEAAKKKALDKAQELTGEDRSILEGRINALAEDLKDCLAKFGSSKIFNSEQMRRSADDSAQRLIELAESSVANFHNYEKEKREGARKSSAFKSEVSSSFIDFSFVPAPSSCPTKSSKSMEQHCPVAPIEGEKNSIHKGSLPSSSEEVPEEHRFHGKSIMQHCGTVLAEKIMHTIGRRNGICFDIGCQALTSSKMEHQSSKWRDTIVSASVEVGITEVIASNAKMHIPVWLGLLGIETVARVGHASVPILKKLERQDSPGFDIQTGLTFQETIQASLVAVKIIQAPQALLHAVNDTITNTISPILDSLGLTDQNISLITRRTLEIIYENAPDLIEERLWAEAYTSRSERDEKKS